MIDVYVAFVLDLLIGDPRWLPHPVVWIGKLISRLETVLRRLFRAPAQGHQSQPTDGGVATQADDGSMASAAKDHSTENRAATPTADATERLNPEHKRDRNIATSTADARVLAAREKYAGVLLATLVVGASGGAVLGLLWLAGKIHPWLAVFANIWLISTTIAVRGLAEAGNGILRALAEGDLERARELAGWIVSRDTKRLSEPEVVRAAVESVAENIVDAVVAPLFYAMLGGAPLAMAYRAANTLDSMVGYKNDRYLHFGWASARLDDVLNWIPARITGLLVVAAAWILRYSAAGAWRTIRRDAAKHPSPNSGIPEAGVAGALGIRLGGRNIYHGRESFRSYMGEPLHELAPIHIRQTIRILYVSSGLVLAVGGIVWWMLAGDLY